MTYADFVVARQVIAEREVGAVERARVRAKRAAEDAAFSRGAALLEQRGMVEA